MNRPTLLSIFLFACANAGHAPECDEHQGAPYPCSDAARQAKTYALQDVAAIADRDGIADLALSAGTIADRLSMATTDAERAAACAQADFWLAQAICDYAGSDYVGASMLVADWRSARGLK